MPDLHITTPALAEGARPTAWSPPSRSALNVFNDQILKIQEALNLVCAIGSYFSLCIVLLSQGHPTLPVDSARMRQKPVSAASSIPWRMYSRIHLLLATTTSISRPRVSVMSYQVIEGYSHIATRIPRRPTSELWGKRPSGIEALTERGPVDTGSYARVDGNST
ncbi:hypothetical protein K474DRAFT_1369942 [Panus rudis PR-1116 ss-1]|nr:hypothetical protein K474DRAFT_1369942 [Panus rudis PR-1116 ss-1]